MPENPARPEGAGDDSAGSWWTLALLIVLLLYTIADRPMINLLVEPLRRDLGLSDLQVGLVQGVSVALFTAFAAYPIAWMADRFDRRWVLAASIAVWTASFAWVAMSRSFGELFVASALVGAGEAALVPIALAMIPTLFRGSRRHLANTLLVVGGRLGVGIVIALCGWLIMAVEGWRDLLPAPIADLAGWRLALLAVAVPGFALVPLILTMARQPAVPTPRQQDTTPLPGSAERPAIVPVWPFLRHEVTAFGSLYAGVALQALAIGCVLNFAPAVAMRVMGSTPMEAGRGVGAATFAATVAGFLIAQVLIRQLGTHAGQRLPAIALMGSAALGILPLVGLLHVGTPMGLYVGAGFFLTVVMAGTLLYPTALQDMTPAAIRARMASIAITVNIVLAALGPAIVGAASDQLKSRPDGLLIAMVGTAVVALACAFAALWPLAVRYPRTVAAARRAEREGMGAAASAPTTARVGAA